MTTVAKAASKYGHFRNLVTEILSADRGNVAVRFDEWDVIEEGCCDPAEYPYTDRDIDVAREWRDAALEELKNAVESAGLQMEMPYNDSIYIHRGNGRAITLRDHKIANSTWRHWDELFSYNFGQTIDDHIIVEL